MLGCGRGEVNRCGLHAGAVQGVEGFAEFLCPDEGGANDAEGVPGAAAFGTICALNQAGAGVQQGGFVSGNAHARHDPAMAPVPEGHIPGKTGAGDDVQVAAAAQLLVHHDRQLTAGQAVAHRHFVAAYKADGLLPHQATLYPVSQGVWPIQNHQTLPGGRAVLNAVAQGGQEGVVPASYVRHVIDQGVEKRKGLLRQPLGISGVQTADRQTAFLVNFVRKQSTGGFIAPDAVLRGQQQPQIAALLQNIKGGFVPAGAPGRAGQQSHAARKKLLKFRDAVGAE